MSQATLLPETTASPFLFQNSPIRTQIDGEQLWFVAKDVCAALEIAWNGKIFSAFPKAWQGMRSFLTPSGNQRLKVISEPAVYKLAFRSNKPEADAFTDWVASEVLPSIRKTGQFAPQLSLDISTTAERKPLEKLVKVWISQAGIPHAQAWTQVNAHFNLGSITELPTPWLPDAINFVEGKIDALPKALPPAPHDPIHVERLQLTPWDKVQLGKQTVEILERCGKVGPRTLECILLKLRYFDAIQDVLKLGNNLAADINKVRAGVFGKIVQAGNVTGCPTDSVMDTLCDDTYRLQNMARDFELAAFRALNASICGAKMLGV